MRLRQLLLFVMAVSVIVIGNEVLFRYHDIGKSSVRGKLLVMLIALGMTTTPTTTACAMSAHSGEHQRAYQHHCEGHQQK